MKKILFFLKIGIILSFSLVFFSCTTGIPGELKHVVKNIASEYYAIAEEWMIAKKYSKAIVWYEKARAYPDYYNASTYQIARAQALLKNWEQAKIEYEILIKQDSDNIMILTSYAYVLANLGQVNQAMDIYKKLVEQHKHDVSLYKNYITLLALSGSVKEARALFDELSLQYPEDDSLIALSKRIEEQELKLNPPAEEEKTDSDLVIDDELLSKEEIEIPLLDEEKK